MCLNVYKQTAEHIHKYNWLSWTVRWGYSNRNFFKFTLWKFKHGKFIAKQHLWWKLNVLYGCQQFVYISKCFYSSSPLMHKWRRKIWKHCQKSFRVNLMTTRLDSWSKKFFFYSIPHFLATLWICCCPSAHTHY